jgi:putative ABC transport system permease protein
MLGIIIGVASVIAMLAIGQGSKKSIEEQISSMGTNMLFIRPESTHRRGVSMGSENTKCLTEKDAYAIKKQCHSVIIYVSPIVRSQGQAVAGSNNWPTYIYGVTPDYLYIRNLEIKSGIVFTERDAKISKKVCLIGKTVVDNLFGEEVNPVGKNIRFNKIPFKVIGVLKSKGESTFGQDQDNIIIAPFSTVQKRILAITYVQTIQASTKNKEVTEQAIDQIEKLLRQRHKLILSDESDFEIHSQQEFMNMLSSTSNIMTALLAAIAGISLLVGGIGIMNIMYVSVTERTHEIGLRMAIGGKGRDILLQFLIESIFLSILGGIIGIILGVIISNVVSNFMNWPVIITANSIILSFLFCSFIGMFFGWYPAKKASKLNPIDALRYE